MLLHVLSAELPQGIQGTQHKRKEVRKPKYETFDLRRVIEGKITRVRNQTDEFRQKPIEIT